MAGTNTKKIHKFDHAPVILLAQPQLGENIGAAARAMMNCGITELRLIDPRDGWPGYVPKNSRHKAPHNDAETSYQNALAASAGATNVIEGAKVYETVEDATKDLKYVLAATARQREMTKPCYDLDQAIKNLPPQKGGILFGCEKAGLLNDDIALCDGILNIPLNPGFTSLNLGQAVLIACYGWFSKKSDITLDLPEEDMAEKDDIYYYFDRLENALDTRGFFDKTPDKKDRMIRNIRNIYTRGNLTKTELNILHGILSLLDKK